MTHGTSRRETSSKRGGTEGVDSLAARLRRLRAALGWTQERLAHEADVHPKQISDYESGRRTPRPQTLSRLLDAAGPEAVAASGLPPRAADRQGQPIADRATALGELARRRADAALAELAAALTWHATPPPGRLG